MWGGLSAAQHLYVPPAELLPHFADKLGHVGLGSFSKYLKISPRQDLVTHKLAYPAS